MPSITGTNLANAIVKLVASEAMAPLLGELVMGNLVNRSYEPLLATQGDTANVPIPGTMTANVMGFDAGTVTKQNPNLGNGQIVLNRHIEATFSIPDVYQAIAFPGVMAAYMGPALNALATKVETDLLALYAGFTSNTAIGTAAVPITEALVDQAESVMFNALVPASQPRYMIVDSGNYGAIRSIPRFSEAQTAAEAGVSALIAGKIGILKGINIFRSQMITVTGGTNNHCIAFHKDAIGMIMRRLPQPLPGTGAIAEYGELGNFGYRVVLSYEPGTLAQTFTVDMLYGVAVLRNAFGLHINA